MSFSDYLGCINVKAQQLGYTGYIVADLGLADFFEDYQDGIAPEDSLSRALLYDEVQANLNLKNRVDHAG